MLHHHHVLAVSLYSSLLEALFLFAQRGTGVCVLEVENLVVVDRVGG